MKHTTISLLALILFTSPSLSGEYGNCHGCSTVSVTTTTTIDGNRANERIHAVQPGGSCNWVNCKVESVMLKGSGPDPQTRIHTETFEVCPLPRA